MSRSPRRCSECGGKIDSLRPDAKTCSAKCRGARKRRIDRQRQRAGGTPHGGERPENEVYEPEQHDLARKVAAAELAPYVRDQITEDVVNAIGGMMSLAPAAVAVIQADLTNPDPHIRMRAAALVTKYTMGDRLVPDDVGSGNTMKLVLEGMPTLGPEQDSDAPDELEGEATELRLCERCEEEKPDDEFEAGAPRCIQCQAEVREEVLARRGG